MLNNKHTTTQFKALLTELGLTYADLADMLGLSHETVITSLSRSKLPRWAISMLITHERIHLPD